MAHKDEICEKHLLDGNIFIMFYAVMYFCIWNGSVTIVFGKVDILSPLGLELDLKGDTSIIWFEHLVLLTSDL